MVLNLPKEFVFGGATAAYQVEGSTKIDGKGQVCWDILLEKDGRFSPDPASDFYNRYPEDLKLSHEYGMDAIRISIAWSRIFPDGTGKINPKGVAFYHDLIDECLKQGIEPYVTLHHFDTPLPLHVAGDWLSREMIDAFVEYAKFCFAEYGTKVKKWITINEPASTAQAAYIMGSFPPNIKYDIPKAIQAMHNQMVAHARVVNVFKENGYNGEVGIVHILESYYPADDAVENVTAANRGNVLLNQFMLDALYKGYYDSDTMLIISDILEKNNGVLDVTSDDLYALAKAAKHNDFLGLNYYQSHFVQPYEGESYIHHNGTGDKGTAVFKLNGVAEKTYNAQIPRTDWDWVIYPKGLYDMMFYIKNRYTNYKAIYVTENGLGYKDEVVNGNIADQPRIDYVEQHLAAVQKAIEVGINVKGYFIWSLQDMFSWTNGYNKRYGLFYVDFDTQERIPKSSAIWWKELSARTKSQHTYTETLKV